MTLTMKNNIPVFEQYNADMIEGGLIIPHTHITTWHDFEHMVTRKHGGWSMVY